MTYEGDLVEVSLKRLGGTVLIRRIPGRLMRQLELRCYRNGKIDKSELDELKLYYAMVNPVLTRAQARSFLEHNSFELIDAIDRESNNRPAVDGGGVIDSRLMRTALVLVRCADARRTRAPQARSRQKRRGGHHARGSRRGTRTSRAGPSDDSDSDSAEPRTCDVCGKDISHFRPNARTCSPAHKQQAYRDRLRPPEPERIGPTCSHPSALPDQDGDQVCIKCGTLVETTGHVNGYDTWKWHMETDSDGLRYRVNRKLPKGAGV